MGDLDWEDWNPKEGKFMHHCIAGSIAGITEHTVMFPVDTIKTHVQCVKCPERHVMDMVKSGGVTRLWRGVSTMLTGCVPAHALYFSVLEQCKERLGVNRAGHHPAGAAVAGACATVFHDAVMTPMDVVKQRLQLGFYNGIGDCVRSIYHFEGWRAFYLSFPTTLFMNIPYGCVMVAMNESIKRALRPDGDLQTWHYMVSGSGAGAVAAAATNPLDVIKTRLQTQALYSSPRAAFAQAAATTTPSHMPRGAGALKGLPKWVTPGGVTVQPVAAIATAASSAARCSIESCPKEAPVKLQYAGLADAMKQIYAKEGAAGFMRGVVPRLLVHSPSVAVSWTAYETVKHWLQEADL